MQSLAELCNTLNIPLPATAATNTGAATPTPPAPANWLYFCKLQKQLKRLLRIVTLAPKLLRRLRMFPRSFEHFAGARWTSGREPRPQFSEPAAPCDV